MKLVKVQGGGYSIAVYKPGSRKKNAERLLAENKVNFVASGDYRTNGLLDYKVKAFIRQVADDYDLKR